MDFSLISNHFCISAQLTEELTVRHHPPLSMQQLLHLVSDSGGVAPVLVVKTFLIPSVTTPRITTSTGEDISGTRLGEKLFLRIEMDQESIFGIFARNLKAISGDNEDEIELLDSRGCPTDPIIFPGLQLLPNRRDLQGSFEAFKFSDTSIVRFQVNVQFCVEQCNPVQCKVRLP